MAAPTRENLERLARLVADGTLRVHVQATYELAQAPDALSALGSAHSQGKLAIHINDTTRHQLSHHIAVSDKANATSGNGRFAGKVAFGAGSGSGRARAHGGVVASSDNRPPPLVHEQGDEGMAKVVRTPIRLRSARVPVRYRR
jgi:hypothetical protein